MTDTEPLSPKRRGPLGRDGSLRRWALRFPPVESLQWTRTINADDEPSDSVSVAIPHWNAPDWCRSTVASFLGQVGVTLTLVVVDNSASDAHSLALPRDVEVITPERNLGYAGAVNLVLARWLQQPAGEVFVAACHDAVVMPATLRTLAAALAALPGVGIVGLDGGDSDPPPGAVVVSPRVWVSGTCFAIRRSCAQEIGRLDERLGTYDEDLDLCLRAWDSGWQVAAVSGLRAHTHGSIARDRTERIAHNHVLLADKRRGMAGALAEVSIQWRRGIISTMKSVLPSTHDRGGSRRDGWQRLVGSTRGLSAAIRARMGGAG